MELSVNDDVCANEQEKIVGVDMEIKVNEVEKIDQNNGVSNSVEMPLHTSKIKDNIFENLCDLSSHSITPCHLKKRVKDVGVSESVLSAIDVLQKMQTRMLIIRISAVPYVLLMHSMFEVRKENLFRKVM